MALTGETIPAEKHVRIKFHQTGPSKLEKFTPTVYNISIKKKNTKNGILTFPLFTFTTEGIYLYPVLDTISRRRENC